MATVGTVSEASEAGDNSEFTDIIKWRSGKLEMTCVASQVLSCFLNVSRWFRSSVILDFDI